MKTNRRFLLAAIFGFALIFTFSCSSGGGSGDGTGLHGGGTSSPSSGGGGLVNADNEAWLRADDNALIFKPNGEVLWIIKSKKNAGKWCLQERSAYSISGNQLCIDGRCNTYTINVDTFTRDNGDSYFRTSGTYIISGKCFDEKDYEDED